MRRYWETMTTLNLADKTRTTLPASAFPNSADIYVCDNCGRDITKHLHSGRAHVWRNMGPNRYECLCGQRYLTGATEWDHLGEWERRRRSRETLWLGILSSTPFLLVGLLIYLAVKHSTGTLIGISAFVVCPFLVVNLPFWFKVAGSIWRTRFSSGIKAKRT